MILYWVELFKGPTHIVFYEKMKQDPEKELRDLMQFLNLTVDERRLYCSLTSNDQTKFQRKAVSRRNSSTDINCMYDSQVFRPH